VFWIAFLPFLFFLGLLQFGTTPRFFPRPHRSLFTLVRSESHHIHARRLQHAPHLFPPTPGQMIGKEAAVAHDQAYRHLLFSAIKLPLRSTKKS
jgi:hypothetical protein